MQNPIDVHRLSAALPPARGWGKVVHLAEVGSTNTEAQRRGSLWSPVLTDLQSAGRGRLGRSWQDRPEVSLALSVVVPAVDPPGWVPLATGLAVRAALDEHGVHAVLKWPNDVLLPADDHRKVAGILCQQVPGQPAVVVGVGINVDHARADLPVATATSLRLVGVRVDRTDLAASVLTHLHRIHADLAAGGERGRRVRRSYELACDTIGRRITLHRPDGGREQVEATGIDPDGRLRVTGPSGSDTVAAGDVQHIRAPGASPR